MMMHDCPSFLFHHFNDFCLLSSSSNTSQLEVGLITPPHISDVQWQSYGSHIMPRLATLLLLLDGEEGGQLPNWESFIKALCDKSKKWFKQKKMGFSGKLCQENTDEIDTFTLTPLQVPCWVCFILARSSRFNKTMSLYKSRSWNSFWLRPLQ